jgi:DNA-binding Xre family transcriptional regulator
MLLKARLFKRILVSGGLARLYFLTSKMSEVEVAEALGISQDKLNAFFWDEEDLTKAELYLFCKKVGCQLSDIIIKQYDITKDFWNHKKAIAEAVFEKGSTCKN